MLPTKSTSMTLPGYRASMPLSIPSPHDRFPFTVNIARDESLLSAIEIRAEAYGRHIPELGVKFREADELDVEAGVTVLVATSKDDGRPLGTIRIQTNQFRPLLIEQAIAIPDQEHMMLAELTRLAVCQKPIGRIAKHALFKATYEYCLQAGIDRLVIGARSPLDRQYRGLGFEDLYPGVGPIPLAYAGNIPHHILYSDIATASAKWKSTGNPIYEFLTVPNHPDIHLEKNAIFRT
jgi:hypothetical protein